MHFTHHGNLLDRRPHYSEPVGNVRPYSLQLQAEFFVESCLQTTYVVFHRNYFAMADLAGVISTPESSPIVLVEGELALYKKHGFQNCSNSRRITVPNCFIAALTWKVFASFFHASCHQQYIDAAYFPRVSQRFKRRCCGSFQYFCLLLLPYRLPGRKWTGASEMYSLLICRKASEEHLIHRVCLLVSLFVCVFACLFACFAVDRTLPWRSLNWGGWYCLIMATFWIQGLTEVHKISVFLCVTAQPAPSFLSLFVSFRISCWRCDSLHIISFDSRPEAWAEELGDQLHARWAEKLSK